MLEGDPYQRSGATGLKNLLVRSKLCKLAIVTSEITAKEQMEHM